MKKWWEKYYWWLFAAGVAGLTLLCFCQLGAAPVYAWDEARHGINAYEMMQQGDYVANYYNGELDYWNLKPPLSFYLVMLGYRIFGYNAWGLRFFSAFCYIVLAVIVALYLRKKFNPLASLLSIAMFAGGYVYFIFHFVRAGDADALFILLIGVAYIALLKSSDNANWLHLTGLAVALAFLTKSYHALIMLPIIGLYLLFTQGFKSIKWWQYFTVTLVTLAPVAIWVGCRAAVDGGKFFHDMLFVDVLNRSTQVVDNEVHAGYPFFYLIWTLATAVNIIAIGLLLFNLIRKFRRREAWDNLDKITLIAWFCFWLIYAVARSKFEWYIYPLCVPLTIYAAVRVSEGLTVLNWHKAWRAVSLTILAASVLTTLIWVVIPPQRDELQALMQELPVTAGATYYFQDGEYDIIDHDQGEQGALLVFEWRTGQVITKGGAAAFQTANNAYLIMKKDANFTPSATMKEITSSEHYVLYYRE